jgi:hypothetical protein
VGFEELTEDDAMHDPYACPECQGHRVVECYACGHEVDCDVCDGTGLDGSRIDLDAFTRASEALQHEERVTWAWVEGGVVCGRRNSARTLAYEDFRLPAEEPHAG